MKTELRDVASGSPDETSSDELESVVAVASEPLESSNEVDSGELESGAAVKSGDSESIEDVVVTNVDVVGTTSVP